MALGAPEGKSTSDRGGQPGTDDSESSEGEHPTSPALPTSQPPNPPLACKALLAAAVGIPRPTLTRAAIAAGEVQAAFLWQERQPGEEVQRRDCGQDAWGLARPPPPEHGPPQQTLLSVMEVVSEVGERQGCPQEVPPLNPGGNLSHG